MENEEIVQQRLEQLQKQLGKKLMFEESVSAIRSILNEKYSSASPSLRKTIFSVVCRVSTILKTRYTSPGFWSAGLDLFLEAQRLVIDESDRKHLQTCIDQARDQLSEAQNEPEPRRNRGYLFEGHLTVDPEPPQPTWLVQSNLLAAAAEFLQGEHSGVQSASTESGEGDTNLLQELLTRLDDIVPDFLDADSGVPRAPPASKEVVAKLPVTKVTTDMLTKLGKDALCSICQEVLIVNDEMQELPCNHMFHPLASNHGWYACKHNSDLTVTPLCLIFFELQDEHNSCPVCRHELKTDDHDYESWKEREREAEEERKGAANAVRGGEYMYV